MAWNTTREELQGMDLDKYSKTYNEAAPGYPWMDNWYSNGSHWHRTTFFLKYIKPEHVVLDCGCSNGGLSLFLAKEVKCQVFAQDICTFFVENTRKNTKDLPNVLQCFASPVEQMPLASEFFDIAIAGELLEHVLSIEDALAEMLRVLKPGGYLLATTPRNPDENAQHLRHIDVEGWNKLLPGCIVEDNQYSWLVAYKKETK